MSDEFESVVISGFTLSPEDGADVTLATLDALSDEMAPYRWGQVNADDLISAQGAEFTLGRKVTLHGSPVLFTVTGVSDLFICVQPVLHAARPVATIAIARTALSLMGMRLAE